VWCCRITLSTSNSRAHDQAILCDPAAVEVWDHDGKLYEVNSYYSLPDVAWQYELIGLTGAPGTGPYLAIVIPDATPDEGPFSPKHVGHALVRIGGGVAPWPILLRLIELAESGDIVDTDQAHVTADDEILRSRSPTVTPTVARSSPCLPTG
jgi:hypothetical protein